ncbi:MAG: insulinase family protein [Candidatus Omnitrophica bacterium]|nr:insulinase family protein [Candidatus Omnitrophota bacterium]
MYKKVRLPNGLRIIVKNLSDREAVSLGIWIGVGGRFEQDLNKGISHYLEHILFKGSKKYTCRSIKETIEGKGGSLNGFTSEEYTCYLVKVLKENLYQALEILSDMVLYPRLEDLEINKERTVIIEEIKMYKDLPQYHVLEILDSLIFPSHPLGQNLAGTLESVASIDRCALDDFQRKFYKPSNIVISVCGAFKIEELIKKIETIFIAKDKADHIKPLASGKQKTSPQVKFVSKQIEQSHLAIGFRSYSRSHPDRHAIDLLHVIMGANMSSRLFQEVREKRGLAYSIGTTAKRFSDSGAFIVHAGVDNSKVAEAVDVIIEELEKIKKSLNVAELKRAKDFLLGQLTIALEDVADHMLFMGEATISLNKVDTLDQIKDMVSKINTQDIKRVAGEIFNLEKINLSGIGPFKDEQVKSLKERLLK